MPLTFPGDFDPTEPVAAAVSLDWKTGEITYQMFAGDDCVDQATDFPDKANVRKDFPDWDWGVIANQAAGPLGVEALAPAVSQRFMTTEPAIAAQATLIYLSAVDLMERLGQGDLDEAWAATEMIQRTWPLFGLAINRLRIEDLPGEYQTEGPYA